MYPTLASSNPFPSNVLRKRCSTPQKQPAATVHFCALAGKSAVERPSGLRDMRVEVVKGRKRRVRKLGIVEAMMRARTERMRVVRSFSLKNV